MHSVVLSDRARSSAGARFNNLNVPGVVAFGVLAFLAKERDPLPVRRPCRRSHFESFRTQRLGLLSPHIEQVETAGLLRQVPLDVLLELIAIHKNRGKERR